MFFTTMRGIPFWLGQLYAILNILFLFFGPAIEHSGAQNHGSYDERQRQDLVSVEAHIRAFKNDSAIAIARKLLEELKFQDQLKYLFYSLMLKIRFIIQFTLKIKPLIRGICLFSKYSLTSLDSSGSVLPTTKKNQ